MKVTKRVLSQWLRSGLSDPDFSCDGVFIRWLVTEGLPTETLPFSGGPLGAMLIGKVGSAHEAWRQYYHHPCRGEEALAELLGISLDWAYQIQDWWEKLVGEKSRANPLAICDLLKNALGLEVVFN